MSTIPEKQNGEWYDALPPRGGVYDLASAAVGGKTRDERLQAVAALGRSDDPRAVRPLADLLADSDAEIRLFAATALGQLKSGRPVEELIGRLRDRSERTVTREQSAAALSAIRSTGALHGLRDFVADDSEDPGLRDYAMNLLKNITPR